MSMLLAALLFLATPSSPDPAAVVSDVYRFHFAHQQRSDLTLKHARASFTPELLALLDADAKAAAANADEVVGLDFDPLTNSQEAADRWSADAPKIEGDRATVAITLKTGGETMRVVARLE